MRKTIWMFLLLAAVGGPAAAGTDDAGEGKCLAAPNYDCLVAGALAAAESEPDRGERAPWLAFLAATQAHVGRREDAAETLERAFACASSIKRDWSREYFAALVVWAKAGMGEFDEAAELAAHLEIEYHGATAWAALARGQALNGDRGGAARSLRMAEAAADQNWRGDGRYVRALLAIAFAYAGKPDRAHELVEAYIAEDGDESEDEDGNETEDGDVEVTEGEGGEDNEDDHADADDDEDEDDDDHADEDEDEDDDKDKFRVERPSRLLWTLYAQAAGAVAEAIAGHGGHAADLIAEARAREKELKDIGKRAVFLGYVSWGHAERGDRDAMLTTIGALAALDLDEATAGDRSIALAFAAMAMARAES